MADHKTKVVDIVMLMDLSESMQRCIDAVKNNVSVFVSRLEARDENNKSPATDWRIKVCGYRNHQATPGTTDENWFVDNPFVTDVASVEAQIAGPSMRASGGGDEPPSLLDALFKIAKTEQSGMQDELDPLKWRASGLADRVTVFFTGATFKSPMTVPEASGGGVVDVILALMGAKIILCGFCPEWEGYEVLASVDRAEIQFVARLDENPALAGLGKPGEEGHCASIAAIEALNSKASIWGRLSPSTLRSEGFTRPQIEKDCPQEQRELNRNTNQGMSASTI
jgi:hypothetical protein